MLQRFEQLKIMQKLMAVGVISLAVFLIGNSLVVVKLGELGGELTSIAEYDLRVTQGLSTISVHQLEQAVAFEKAVAHRFELELGSGSRASIDKAIDKFDELEKKVEKEILDIEALVAQGIEGAYSDKERLQFEKLLKGLKGVEADYEEYVEHAQEYLGLLQRADLQVRHDLLERVEKEQEALDKSVVAMLDDLGSFTQNSMKIATEHEQGIIVILLISFLVAAAISLFLFKWLGRRMSDAITQAIEATKVMAERNHVSLSIETEGRDEIVTIIDTLDQLGISISEASKISHRITRALDVCDTNVMMADTDFNVVYMNHAVQRMMADAEKDLRKDLPNFDARNIMGKNIDIFHQNPAHQRGMVEGLKDTYRTDIKVGGRTFGLIATPIFDEQNNRLGTVVEWDDKTERLALAEEQNRVAAENARIKVALDNVSANVMVADADRNIIYTNDAVIDTLRNAQEDIRKELPNFNVDNLLGNTIDQFHKNPQHQISMLERLTGTHNAKIVVGGRHMHLIVNPVHDDQGKRIGTVVEWADRTAEVRIQDEMDHIVTSANDGDLSERINLSDKEGFFKTLSEGLNSMLDVTASFVHDMSQMFEAMSEGDLTSNITNTYRGEFDVIKSNANNTVAKLTEVMTKVQGASGTVRTSANEVAQGSDDLSRRTESQASSLEETASSMEEITATVKQTSDNASQANTLASEAKKKAQAGGAVVEDAVKAMAEILESSNKINDIIGVIDEIAFQTNLLALNAAVEAARAGEQGRGFAVVAGEVRTLSQRSAAAAKEIKDLIRDSVSKVESGSTLVNQSGSTLSEIVGAVDKVAVMIQDVTNAALEQNSGISQINQAITQMDEMTQQNAALVEETSAASRSMSEEATKMNSLISFFRLNANQMASVESFAVSASTGTMDAEPIQTYTPSSGGEAQSGQDGAASFSESDDWEDF